MATEQPSPRIVDLAWGRIEIEGHQRPFKDAKLYPGGAREWDWRETGTVHTPGIQPADVEELLTHGADVIVLSTGVYKRLGVCPETLQELDKAAVDAHVLQTDDAVRVYNELSEAHRVGALIHSTC